MNYVVIDLEWNQYHNPLRTPTSRSGVKMHEEIIQIGAIKTDHAMNPVDTFSLYVRLGGGRRLDKYVRKLTHISESDIARGEDFAMASAEFVEWLKDVDAIFSWGPDDRRVFLNNLAFYDLPAPACAWYDAQKIFADQVPEHGGLALKTVAEAMNVRVSLTLHDAMNDAILTAFCMAKLDMEAGVKNYVSRKNAAESGQPQPVATAKTHRHVTQQAAWEEACNGLMRCPACMQNLEWVGEEKGTIARWYKTAHCATHGDYIVRGEFNGTKMYTLKFSFFPATPEVLEMVKKETEPAETPAKKRRRKRKKKTAAEAPAEVLAPEELLARAIAFAAEAHKTQTRKGGSIPYIVHPMEAAAIAATMTDDAAVLAAAVLHDTVEDCEAVTPEIIEQKFGAHVADLVAFESEKRTEEDKAASWHARKQETLDRLTDADEEQLMLVLADKLSNARALYRDYAVLKNELWKRFNQPDKREQAWYYRALAERFGPLSRFEAYGEFVKLVNAVFGRPRTAKKTTEIQTN